MFHTILIISNWEINKSDIYLLNLTIRYEDCPVKVKENWLIMISNTIEMLFIEYINTFLQKKCFSSCNKLYIDLRFSLNAL